MPARLAGTRPTRPGQHPARTVAATVSAPRSPSGGQGIPTEILRLRYTSPSQRWHWGMSIRFACCATFFCLERTNGKTERYARRGTVPQREPPPPKKGDKIPAAGRYTHGEGIGGDDGGGIPRCARGRGTVGGIAGDHLPSRGTQGTAVRPGGAGSAVQNPRSGRIRAALGGRARGRGGPMK